MDWIPWNDLLKTGQPEMDADHAKLAELFNALGRAVKNRKDIDVCVSLLDDIVRHTKTHFEHEDQLMAERRYPKAEQHRAEHSVLLRQALAYRAKVTGGAAGTYIPLIYFPEDWLTRHIRTADRLLADFLATPTDPRPRAAVASPGPTGPANALIDRPQ